MTVVSVFIAASEIPLKDKIVNALMDDVVLLSIAKFGIECSTQRGPQLELYTNYSHLCGPSNPITTKVFGDDLPNAVKDIPDANRTTSTPNTDDTIVNRRDRLTEYPAKFQRHSKY